MTYIATSKNGKAVYFKPDATHLATHLNDTPQLLGYIKQAIVRHDFINEEVKFEHVFDSIIGECDLQTTSTDDEIVYAIRKHRDRYSRFVKHKSRHQCHSVTIIAKQKDDHYELWSAWIGHLVPSFPKLDHPDKDEVAFWNTHALVWGRQEIEPQTMTTQCPWKNDQKVENQ